MLHLRPPLAGNRLPSSNASDTDSVADFDFWDSRNRGSFGSEIELLPQACVQNDLGASSPPLWKKSAVEVVQNETSSLLKHDHCYSHPSSQLERIEQGRRELMEMVKNMSESTYELSLKDIVDEQQASQEGQEEGSMEERSMSFNSQAQLLQPKRKKRKTVKPRKIMRSASMDNEVFLLKMFFPISLGMKRKSAAGNGSKPSGKALCEKPENRVDKEWWKKRFLSAGETRNSGKHSICGSCGSSRSSRSSRSNSSKSRQADGNISPGCWSIFRPKKAKPEGEDDCYDSNAV